MLGRQSSQMVTEEGRRVGICEGAAPHSSCHLGLCHHERALTEALCGELQRPRAAERSR